MAKPRFEARWIRARESDYSVMLIVPGEDLSVHLVGQAPGDPLTIRAARIWMEDRGYQPLGVTNAGIFHSGLRPVGLFVEGGITKSPLNLSSGTGNFFMKPNGVFSWTPGFGFSIDRSDLYKPKSRPLLATQSGPLLLERGQPHPDFRQHSSNRAIRNGVGVSSSGDKAIFAISDRAVNLWDFSSFFLSQGCPDALYLDGAISDMWTPIRNAGRSDDYAGLLCIAQRMS